MDRTERFYRIDRMLQERKVVPVRAFLDALEVSLATFKRDIEYMRNRFHAPIVWDRARNGYTFTAPDKRAPAYALPGLWFSAGEIHALLAAEKLLEDVGPGLLAGQLTPLRKRLEQLLGSADHEADEVRNRVRLLHAGRRKMALPHFETVAAATLKRRRLKLKYYSRTNDAETDREVSPQRLVHYRDNWYLDAWCHTREGIRSFAVDAIRGAELLDAKARAVPDKDLDAELASGYGIFGGKNVQWAKLRFNPEAARWVRHEEWHPEQRLTDEPDGSLVMELPFTDERELTMDVLKHGSRVEVLEPKGLRKSVGQTLRASAELYR